MHHGRQPAFLRLLLAVAVGLATYVLTPRTTFAAPLSIYEDNGGQVIYYARKARRIQDSGGSVRFDGPCLSACTLYLSISDNRLCVTPRASFGFHRPVGGSRMLNDVMTQMMFDKYPAWVQTWIDEHGGLGGGMLIMDYSYARRFLHEC